MNQKKKTQSNNVTEDDASRELQTIIKARDVINEQIAEQDRLYGIHFKKSFEAGQKFYALDKLNQKDPEKIKLQKQALEKEDALEKKIYKTHLRKKFSLERKAVTLEKQFVKKQIVLQKILIKTAKQNAEATKKKSDMTYLDKLTKQLNKMESRWEALTEIL
jgi:hypothetical protein